jgi:hypothetical protein
MFMICDFATVIFFYHICECDWLELKKRKKGTNFTYLNNLLKYLVVIYSVYVFLFH